MKRILSLIVLLAAVLGLAAQDYSPCYTKNMSAGEAAFRQGNYQVARDYFLRAKDCPNGNSEAAQRRADACTTATTSGGSTTSSSSSSKTFTVRGVSFTMKYVEGGTFTMGCTSEQSGDCDGDESPTHSVKVSGFWMGETEVTQALWKAVMGSNPSNFRGDNLPVESVSWEDCQEFIRKLNALTGQTFRLPTEAEWEYAARGGNKKSGYKYAGSSSISDVAWYSGTSNDRTHPVKGKKPNALGLYDMSGNVWEWCSDWFGSYSSSFQTDPKGPYQGSARIFRGGAWRSTTRLCRVAIRSADAPDSQYDYVGLRLAF